MFVKAPAALAGAFSLAVAAGLSSAQGAAADSAPQTWTPQEHEFVLHNFHFRSGEALGELRLHYMTLGTPHRDGRGQIDNAVLVLHGTGGSGAQFLVPQFAGQLYSSGQPLDLAKTFVILPDDIGHGRSSKPSDGLHMRFPKYDYADMVEAEHALVVQGLDVTKLRLIMGTSMGCMHAFLWAEAWPDAARALMPMACNPAPIAGRNRLWRRMIVNLIEQDPAWKGGEYGLAEPGVALQGAEDLLAIAGSAAHQMQKDLPDNAAVDSDLAGRVSRAAHGLDANDLIYALEASRDYGPEPHFAAITAPLMWVNSADVFINPPETGLTARLAPKIRTGRFVLLPISPATHGHGTHTWAAAWKPYLLELLGRS